MHHPLLYDAVHLHMLVAGCLFTFAVAGPDSIRGRGSWPVRVGALTAAAAAHAVLAKHLYAHAATLATSTGRPARGHRPRHCRRTRLKRVSAPGAAAAGTAD